MLQTIISQSDAGISKGKTAAQPRLLLSVLVLSELLDLLIRHSTEHPWTTTAGWFYRYIHLRKDQRLQVLRPPPPMSHHGCCNSQC